MPQLFVAVEFDLPYSVADSGLVTLRLANRGPLTGLVAGLPVLYEPLLYTPILLGTQAVTLTSGLPVRAQPNGGTIEFALDEAISWALVDQGHIWPGAVFRLYEGYSAAGLLSDLTLAYTGRVADLSQDTLKATVKTTDGSLDLDNNLVSDFYDATYPTALQGRPRPWGRGRRLSVEPVFVDQANLIYEVGYDGGATPVLDDITELRVGGIAWQRVAGAPAQSQWAPDLANGRVQLGAITDGFGVRCDANFHNWTNCTTAALISEIASRKGVGVDTAAMAAFAAAYGGGDLVGFYSGTSPINNLAALDRIASADAAFWGFGPDGLIFAQALLPPDPSPAVTFDAVTIASASQPEELPSAWRIRCRYADNDSPDPNPATGVTDQEAQDLAAPGIVYEPHFEDGTILVVQPRAVDAPLVDSLFWRYQGAQDLQNRLNAIWGTKYLPRREVDISAWFMPGTAPHLFATVGLQYMMLAGNFRLLSMVRPFGGGAPAQLQLWGTAGYPAAPPPALPADCGLKRAVVLVSGAFTIPATDLEVTFLGAGGGASGFGGATPAGGGSGGAGVKLLTGLTVGDTLMVTLGSAGAGGGFGTGPGSDGGPAVVSSGTQSIATLTAPGGRGATGTMPGFGGAIATGGDLNAFGNGGSDAPSGGIPTIRLGNYGWGGYPGFNYYQGFNPGSGGPPMVLFRWIDCPMCYLAKKFYTVPGTYTFTIPAGVTSLEVVAMGGGSGANSPQGGGSGASLQAGLTGLTPGNTISITVGIGGLAALAGSATIISSGTQTIPTLNAPGGRANSFGGVLATGGDVNAIGNGGGLEASGVPSDEIGNQGWGGYPGFDLYGNGVGAAAAGGVSLEWAGPTAAGGGGGGTGGGGGVTSTIQIVPSTPTILSTTPLGGTVATLLVSNSDGSIFAGSISFVAPHFDAGGVFAISGNTIIVNPAGPGVGNITGTVTDYITLDATP